MSLLEMTGSLKGRDFLSLKDYTSEEIVFLLDFADYLKGKVKKGEPHELLKGKTLGLIFQKSSTRTRVSFEVGMIQLGGYPLFLSATDLQMGRGEPIRDTARVLSRYLDGVMIRTYSHDDVEELATYASIPIINGLTDALHPCQVLADLQTIREHKGHNLKGVKLAYIGDGNNMAHSLMIGGAKMGMEIVIASPGGYEPEENWVQVAKSIAKDTGGKIIVTPDIDVASSQADVLYADVWASMGQEEEMSERKKHLSQYQINEELLKKAAKDVIVMHCLPAHRGEEITEDVIEGKHSVVFDEAEDRLHAQKAILANLL
ncbi:ornithine carbamoyltransferase [endosymbiont 'TC1' of Trimyema compressum]|uniref:ornithine carbamoyltransferase n=1 Tax=endosymbiont 'TC1' of Trimyema compressum TaxID=243899 RepID=UPI000ADB3738|nr:ornithine carbamoyltransferase [endosymbiont 'TC1' of Trimyema compressum]